LVPALETASLSHCQTQTLWLAARLSKLLLSPSHHRWAHCFMPQVLAHHVQSSGSQKAAVKVETAISAIYATKTQMTQVSNLRLMASSSAHHQGLNDVKSRPLKEMSPTGELPSGLRAQAFTNLVCASPVLGSGNLRAAKMVRSASIAICAHLMQSRCAGRWRRLCTLLRLTMLN